MALSGASPSACAKAFVTAGIGEVMGRKHCGVYPLRGKFFNALKGSVAALRVVLATDQIPPLLRDSLVESSALRFDELLAVEFCWGHDDCGYIV